MVEELAGELRVQLLRALNQFLISGQKPHSEHSQGRQENTVASNLYIAIGISGAIQHLAGVNAPLSKVVIIPATQKLPFFKAADYGIVGDAFEVVPQLISKLRDFKAQNS